MSSHNKYENIFWIGGSPCSGKSSIAELLAKRHKMSVYHCDEFSDVRTDRMKAHRTPILTELSTLGKCGRLAKPPRWQAEKEIEFYKEQFDFVLEELDAFTHREGLIVEGADLMPQLLRDMEIPYSHAAWVIPSPGFQLKYYTTRDWAHEYVSDCPDPAKAFDNWMQRDILFAKEVDTIANRYDGKVLIVDGKLSMKQNADIIETHFFAK